MTPPRSRTGLSFSTKSPGSGRTATANGRQTAATATDTNTGTAPTTTATAEQPTAAPSQQAAAVQYLLNVPATVADPFAPRLLDPEQVTGTPAEQLAVLEAAIETSRSTGLASIARAKFRAEVEIGFLLGVIRDRPDLYVPAYGTIERYGEQRWGYKRSTLYELMDTAPVRLAIANGRVSGNPDTGDRKAIAPPRRADDAPAAAPSVQPAPVIRAEISKSVALELLPAWRDGEDTAVEILADAMKRAEQRGKRMTAADVRAAREDWGVEREDRGLTPSQEEQRRAVDKTLGDAVATAEKLIDTLDGLAKAGVPPLDAEAAERHVKALRAAGRWLNAKARVPEEILDAEVVS
ncbi:hypothetical protein AB0C76_33105 [Kitasatospora sp. NPDC048722]|uniref:hypothetical protein n=1 Tax=Kitasatospora sp. NPDC048722 TaxID=3155639 RepID=UPI0033ED84F8